MRTDSLAFRLIASAALWSLLVLLAGGLALSSIFRQSVELEFDGRLEFRLESLIASVEVGADGQIELVRSLGDARFERAYSGWYWQVTPEDGAEPLRSRSLWDRSLTLPAREDDDNADDDIDAVRGAFVDGPEGQRLRVLERMVGLPGADAPFAFAVASDTAALEEEIRSFNDTTFVALAVLGSGLLVALFIQVRFGLRPLEAVRRALAAIRSGRAARLDGKFPAEIESLAGELNSLLDYNREVLERARTHTGNLAHALKTPLSVLTNEARANPGPLGDLVGQQAADMREQIDRHLARARTAASANVLGARTPVGPAVDRLARALARIHEDRHLEIETAVPSGVSFRGEAQDLEEMVGNLLDNACKWATSKVRISAAPAPPLRQGRRAFRLNIDDDGRGLPAEQRGTAIKRGERLDESVPGSGLGLSIVSEIAELYGGELKLGESELGGLAASLVLPAADPPAP